MLAHNSRLTVPSAATGAGSFQRQQQYPIGSSFPPFLTPYEAGGMGARETTPKTKQSNRIYFITTAADWQAGCTAEAVVPLLLPPNVSNCIGFSLSRNPSLHTVSTLF